MEKWGPVDVGDERLKADCARPPAVILSGAKRSRRTPSCYRFAFTTGPLDFARDDCGIDACSEKFRLWRSVTGPLNRRPVLPSLLQGNQFLLARFRCVFFSQPRVVCPRLRVEIAFQFVAQKRVHHANGSRGVE